MYYFKKIYGFPYIFLGCRKIKFYYWKVKNYNSKFPWVDFLIQRSLRTLWTEYIKVQDCRLYKTAFLVRIKVTENYNTRAEKQNILYNRHPSLEYSSPKSQCALLYKEVYSLDYDYSSFFWLVWILLLFYICQHSKTTTKCWLFLKVIKKQ